MCEIAEVGIGICLGVFGYVDIKSRLLPAWSLGSFHLLSIVLAIVLNRHTFFSVLGGVCVGMFFFIVSKVTKESIGYGDSWLILSLGIYLGWRQIVGVVFIANLLAGVTALFVKRKQLPFIPFLAVAYGLVVFL